MLTYDRSSPPLTLSLCKKSCRVVTAQTSQIPYSCFKSTKLFLILKCLEIPISILLFRRGREVNKTILDMIQKIKPAQNPKPLNAPSFSNVLLKEILCIVSEEKIVYTTNTLQPYMSSHVLRTKHSLRAGINKLPL